MTRAASPVALAAGVLVANAAGCSLLVHLGEEEPAATDAGGAGMGASDAGSSAMDALGTTATNPMVDAAFEDCAAARADEPWNNCGACGHRCCGMTCIDDQCVFGTARTVESDDQPTAIAFDADDGTLYWTRNDDGGVALARLPPSASAPSVVVTGLPFVRDMVAGGGAVFAATAPATIVRISTAPTPMPATASPIVSGEMPYGLVLAGGLLFWADDNGAIRQANADGTGEVALYQGLTPYGPYAVALSGSNLAWTDSAAGHTVTLGSVDGGPAVAYPQAMNYAPGPLAMDDAGVYWGDLAVGELVAMPLDGGAAATLVPPGGAGSITAVAVDDTYIYWVLLAKDGSATGTLSATTRDGAHKQVLVDNLAGPKALVASETCLYWVDEGTGASAFAGNATPFTGSVMSIEKPPPPTTP